MNHLKIYVTSILMSAAMLNIGCMSTVSDHARSTYNSVKRGLAVKPDNSDTDQLYAQVKTKDQSRVNQLTHELQITEQTKQLADLEEQRDDLQRERSRINHKRVELLAQETEYRVQLAKLEAIDRNRLGDKIDNIERIADTHVDAIDIQKKRLQLDGEGSILDVKIEQIKQQIVTQQQTIEQLKQQS